MLETPCIRVLGPACVLAALCPTPAAASETAAAVRYDQVHLGAGAEREVETDLLVAEVYKEHTSDSQATAAGEVNRAVSWGIERAESAGVRVEPSGYRTHAVYQRQRLAGWRVYQSIRLHSADAQVLAALLGELQERLAVHSVRHVLSPQARREVEDALTTEALLAFQERAALVARTLGRTGHRIVRLDIATVGGEMPRPEMMMRAAAAAGQESAPATQGGRERVVVRVDGTIELLSPPR